MRPTNGHPATDKPTFRPLDDQQTKDRPPASRRVTVAEAAVLMGISEDAVRSRLKRGTLRRETGRDGAVLVVLGADQPSTGNRPTNDRKTDRTTTGEPTDEATDQGELVEALQERIEHLSRIIDTRDEEIRRRDTIIMTLSQRVPELEAPPEPRDGPETAAPRFDRGAAPEDSQGPIERRERSWWRRFFGFE